ncbi:MAG: hypothetical protein F9K16_09500, partial [Thermoanaerobaculia bacterium]
TLDYAAPEQLRGQPVGPPADVYGVGLLLFEAATGTRLWNRSAARPERTRASGRPAASEVADELREWLATPAAQRSGRSWWSKKSVIRR